MVHPVFHAFQKQATHYLHWKKLRNFNMEARVPDLVSTNKLSYEIIFYATAVCFVWMNNNHSNFWQQNDFPWIVKIVFDGSGDTLTKLLLAEQRVKWQSVIISSYHWKRTTLFRSVFILYCQSETGVYTKTSTLQFSHNWNIQSVCTAQLMNMTVLNTGNWPFQDYVLIFWISIFDTDSQPYTIC